VGRVLSFVKLIQGADLVDRKGRQHGQLRKREQMVGPA
jgi:hypothetical protein